MLGQVGVRYGEDILDRFPTRSSLALLIYLVETGAGILHTREVLAERLFPGLPPESARKNLRQALYSLRKLFPVVLSKSGDAVPLFETGRDSLRLNPDSDIRLDTTMLTKAIRENKDDGLRQAAIAYHGDFAQDLILPDNAYFESWLQERRQHYREKALVGLETLIGRNLDAGNLQAAAEFGRKLLTLDPLREKSVRLLMEIHAENGARSEALRIFEQFKQMLKEELGVEPEPQTQSLFSEIARGDVRTPLRKSVLSAPDPEIEERRMEIRLPAVPTAFFGRQIEIEAIDKLFHSPDVRLITLFGPGGTGKTRLSIQAAQNQADRFPDGIYFVPLSTVTTVDGLVTAILKTLSISYRSADETSLQQLLNFLTGKELLLILDNFEQLVDTNGAELVAEILRNAPRVILLVTSRARLNIQGERLYLVQGLSTPTHAEALECDSPRDLAAAYSAIQLFVDRAILVNPAFVLTDDNAVDVIKICLSVDGSPLGIELSAAWLELLSPHEVVEEIRKSMDFLAVDFQDLPERQRSVRAVFESSWKLLKDAERVSALRLGAFNGLFSREAAQFVSGGSLRTLLALSNKSWLQHSQEGYFAIHPLLQRYLREQLAAEPDQEAGVLNRRNDYYGRFLERQFDVLRSPSQKQALDAIEAEFDNIRESFRGLVTAGNYSVLSEKMLPALYVFATMREYVDGLIELCETPIPGPEPDVDNPDPDRLVLSVVAGWGGYTFAQWEKGVRDRVLRLWELVHAKKLENALGCWYILLVVSYNMWESHVSFKVLIENLGRFRESFGDWWCAEAMQYLGALMTEQGGLEGSNWAQKALEIFESKGGPFEQARALLVLAHYEAYYMQNPNAALEYLDRVEDHIKKVDSDVLRLDLMASKATILRSQGEFDRAFQLTEALRRYYRKMGALHPVQTSLIYDSLYQSRYGSLELAFAFREEARAIERKWFDEIQNGWTDWETGELHRLAGNHSEARRYFVKAKSIFESTNIELGHGFYHRGLGAIALSENDYSAAEKHFHQFLQYAEKHPWGHSLAHGYLGRALVRLGRFDEAERHLDNMNEMLKVYGHVELKLFRMLALAELTLYKGEYERAVELAGEVIAHHQTWHEMRKDARVVLEEALKKNQ